MAKSLLHLISPYAKLRKGQALLASKIGEAYFSSEILLVQYPPGSGKTLAVLLGALESGVPKVIYLARTKTQFQAPIREAKAFEQRGVRLSVVTLVNKMDLCLLKKEQVMDYREFLRFCKLKRSSGLCPFSSTINKRVDLPAVVDVRTLRSVGMSKGLCPFAVAWSLLSEARVIVASYSYIFDEALFDLFIAKSGLNLKDSLLVIDEAHNLPQQIINLSRKVLGESTIAQARKELLSLRHEAVEISSVARVLESLSRVLRKYSRGEGERELSIEDMEGLEGHSGDIRKLAILYEHRSGVASSLGSVAEFLEALRGASKDYLLYVSSKDGERRLVLVNVNPSRVARRIFSSVRSAVLMSATLPPAEYLVSMLGLEESRVNTVLAGDPWGKRIEAISFSGISSRYAERNPETYRLYGQLITKICSLDNVSRALAVFPSYSFLANVWPHVRVSPKIREYPETTLEEVLSKIASLDRFLLMVVAWGKLVEGIELKILSKNLVDSIIIAGLPMPEPSLENLKILELLRDRLNDEYKAWKYVFYFPAIAKVVQAIGRGVRSEHDRPRVFILDERVRGEGEEYLALHGISVAHIPVGEFLGNQAAA